MFEKIKEVKIEGKTSEEIEKGLSRENKLNPGMAAYILTGEIPV